MQGTRLAHYRMVEPLGKGGMGEVWLARDERLERDVALKFLHPGLGLDEEAEERLLREARSASALRHPGILTIHAIERAEGRTFIVMERLVGATIDEAPTAGGQEESLQRIEDAADALAAAHARGIVHRDVKPSNLFVDDAGRVVVMDFGLARVIDAPELTRSGTTLGTLGYMAPEQLQAGEATPASDVFGLGAVLHELLAGAAPFDRGQGIGGVIRAVLEEDPPAIEGAGEELAGVLACALAKDPAARYPDAGAFRDALRRARGADSQDAPAPRSGARALPIVLLGAAAAAVLLFFALRSGAEDAQEDPTGAPAEPRWIQRDVGLHSMRAEDPALSPDGETVAFVRVEPDGSTELYVAAIDSTAPRSVGTLPGGVREPVWFPDGRAIAVRVRTQDRAGCSDIYRFPLLGGAPELLLEGVKNASFGPADTMVFERPGTIHTFDLESGAESLLLTRPADAARNFDAHPALSPDGTTLAYQRSVLGPLGPVVLRDLESGEERTLIEERAVSVDLAFTPDGEGLLLASDIGGPVNVWTVDLVSGARTQLTSGAGNDLSPSMAGGRIVYQNRRDDSELVQAATEAGPVPGEVRYRTRGSLFGVRYAPSGGALLFGATVASTADAFILDEGARDPVRVPRKNDTWRLFPRWLGEDRILCYQDDLSGPALIAVDRRTGAETVLVEGWSMQDHPYAEPAPDGSRLAIFEVSPPSTLVFDLQDGPADAARLPGFELRWTADGKSLLGTSMMRGGLASLSVPDGKVRPLGEPRGSQAVQAPGGGALYVLRPLEAGGFEILRCDDLGSPGVVVHESAHGMPIASSFDVDAEGRVAYVRFVPRSSEVWLLEPETAR